MPRPPTDSHALLDPAAPRPLLRPQWRQSLVRELRDQSAELGLFPAPRVLADLLRIRLVWRTNSDAPDGPPALMSDVAYYEYDDDRRQCHLNMLVVIASVFLDRWRVAHNWSDALLFALDFAVPFEVCAIDADEMVTLQPHCPEDLIRKVMAERGIL